MLQNILKMLKKGIVMIALCATFLPSLAHAERWYVDTGNIVSKGTNAVIKGYDPVAYFTEGKAVKGKTQYLHTYEGGTFQFSSDKNLQLFKANPGKYAPQYGGYCAYAIGAKNQLVSVDPKQFKIVDGKLYLNYSAAIAKDWQTDIPGYIAKGDKNWPALKVK